MWINTQVAMAWLIDVFLEQFYDNNVGYWDMNNLYQATQTAISYFLFWYFHWICWQ